jgi:predicted Rossmann fold nucleotide-binding protein DprA/Smf involved in DNA uptake
MNSFNSKEPKWEADRRIPDKGEFGRPLIGLVLHMQVKATLIQPADPLYPRQLENAFDRNRLPAIAAAGNLDILQGRMLGLFCSKECPGDVILRTYDLIRALRDAGIPIIGGFHSPMEKECLSLLVRGVVPFLISPARSLEGMRLPSAWKKPLDEGRLLVLSPFSSKHRRVTADRSQTRNLLIAALSGQILVAYAGQGSKTEHLCRQAISWGTPLWTPASKENEHLLAMGARPLKLEDAPALAANWPGEEK